MINYSLINSVNQKQILSNALFFDIPQKKKLMADINRGYRNLNVNKVDDILTMNGGVNAQVEPVEEQGAADAQPAA